MNVIALVQARLGSTRFPSKVLRKTNGLTLLQLLLARLSLATELTSIVVVIPDTEDNDPLEEHVLELGFNCERGSEHDVLDRYVTAARSREADIIVRITGDCPLIDPKLVDLCVSTFKTEGVDYLSNNNPPTFPDGLDVEVFSFPVLEKAAIEAVSKFDREHVTPYMRDSQKFLCSSVQAADNMSDLRWTVDEPEDFQVVDAVISHFMPNIFFGWKDILALEASSPEIFCFNRKFQRNEGASIGEGQKLWRRAKKVIPGGNMLLSKRSEMFLPEQWPSYFSRSKGCKIWTLEGRELTDMSIMGIGTNTLGYGHPDVDARVSEIVSQGNMSTLNCPEEVYLAEKLVELHPWSDMVKFARSGGEANAVAIRIARAASGKEGVAFCGYHGWHDWYLAANLSGSNELQGHLLPGLEPKGVPTSLSGTVFPFEYNNFEQLESIVDAHEIGVIKMEVERNAPPNDGFLEKVRSLATRRNIVLIFDECTSGFRECYGGLHKKYNVEPDLCMFGKALGNGYAITAVIGKKSVMEAAQSSFISSTFWTERIGPAAGLATLDVMQEERSWETITMVGKQIRSKWQSLADSRGLEIEHFGIAALAGFNFKSSRALEYKTLITQEMLNKGFLATNSVYASTCHTQDVIDQYFEAITPVFEFVRECEDGRDVLELLEGPVCHSGFRRLN